MRVHLCIYRWELELLGCTEFLIFSMDLSSLVAAARSHEGEVLEASIIESVIWGMVVEYLWAKYMVWGLGSMGLGHLGLSSACLEWLHTQYVEIMGY